MPSIRHRSIAAALSVGIAATAIAAQARAGTSVANTDSTSRAALADGFWTPERIQAAKPLELSATVDLDRSRALPRTSVRVPSVRGEGAPPTLDYQPSSDRIAPAIPESATDRFARPQPKATSKYGPYFTTTRVFPSAATTAYPNSVVGKLFFYDSHDPSEVYYCSASVVRPRIVLTAGHCVAHPSTTASGRYFYQRFMFVPAYSDGVAPFKSWTPMKEFVTDAWINSNGAVPNTQDVGILVANDQTINGKVTKIASVTGYIGYLTGALSDNNVTMLGYPCNLDSCKLMELTNAQTWGSGGSNTYIYGSAMSHGESGGPWLQDYGVAPVGTVPSALGLNYVVAVTSYGPTNTQDEYLGASELDATFLNLLSDACKAETGNC